MKVFSPTPDEVIGRIDDDSETAEAIRHWAKRRLSGGNKYQVNDELIERLEFLLHTHETTPTEIEEEGLDHDWEHG